MELGKIKNPALVSRFDEHALKTALLIDKTIHAGEILARGTLLAKSVSGGKHRAYAEGTVKTGGAFSNAATGFTLDVAVSPLAKHLRVGDVIESVSGTALGTIASYDPVTGAGALGGNSANNLAAGQKVRIAVSQLALASFAGKLLEDQTEVEAANDAVANGYFEGFFLKANTTLTDAAISTMGAVELESGEVRIK